MTNFSLYLAWMTFYVSKFWILGKISKFSKNQVFRPKIGLFQFLFVSTPLLYAAFDGVGRFPQKCIIPFGRLQPLEAALILDIHLWYIFMQRCYDKHFLLSVFCIFHHEKHCPSHLRSSSQRFTNLSPDSFNIQHSLLFSYFQVPNTRPSSSSFLKYLYDLKLVRTPVYSFLHLINLTRFIPTSN